VSQRNALGLAVLIVILVTAIPAVWMFARRESATGFELIAIGAILATALLLVFGPKVM